MNPVRVAIGPVASASVLAWARSARETLDVVRSHPDLDVPADVVDAFEAYVAMWTAIAESSDPFEWSGELDADRLRHLAAHWARLVTLARADGDEVGVRPAPPEGEEFYNALAVAMVEATALDDPERFADHFEDVLPAFNAEIDRRPASRTTTVLLVDDNPDIRLLMRLAVERDGRFEVSGEASNGTEAVAHCRASAPDAVLLDLLMPVMDGFAALPLIKDASPTTRVVVFSALSDPDVRRRVEALGASTFLSKTADRNEVLRALAGD